MSSDGEHESFAEALRRELAEVAERILAQHQRELKEQNKDVTKELRGSLDDPPEDSDTASGSDSKDHKDGTDHETDVQALLPAFETDPQTLLPSVVAEPPPPNSEPPGFHRAGVGFNHKESISIINSDRHSGVQPDEFYQPNSVVPVADESNLAAIDRSPSAVRMSLQVSGMMVAKEVLGRESGYSACERSRDLSGIRWGADETEVVPVCSNSSTEEQTAARVSFQPEEEENPEQNHKKIKRAGTGKTGSLRRQGTGKLARQGTGKFLKKQRSIPLCDFGNGKASVSSERFGSEAGDLMTQTHSDMGPLPTQFSAKRDGPSFKSRYLNDSADANRSSVTTTPSNGAEVKASQSNKKKKNSVMGVGGRRQTQGPQPRGGFARQRTESFLQGNSGQSMQSCITQGPGPLHFDLMQEWQESMEAMRTAQSLSEHAAHIHAANRTMLLMTSNTWSDDAHHGEAKPKVQPFGVLRPDSMKRLLWDLASMLMLAYDVVVIPLQLLEFEENGFMIVMAWIVRTFWLSDMVVSFNTGFLRKNGDIEMRRLAIARNYARRWLPLDTVVNGMEWWQVIAYGSGSDAAQMGRTLRSMRFLRMLRLMRMAKCPAVAQAIIEHIRSQKVQLIFIIVKTLCAIIAMVHVIACVWFGIGDATSDGWVITKGFEDADPVYQYATSYHWALTQFAGSMEVVPNTVLERFYAIFTLLFAFLVATWLVSSLTSSMTQLHISSVRQSTLFASLRRYLLQRDISPSLITRVKMNALHMYKEQQQNIPETEVELLRLVSEPLRAELHFEIHQPVLEVHPLFQLYAQENPTAMRRICHCGISRTSFSRGDILFNSGEAPQYPNMLFLVEGQLCYRLFSEQQCIRELGSGSAGSSIRELGSGHLADSTDATAMSQRLQSGAVELTTLRPGDWAAEGVLWTFWQYCGTMRADADSFIVLLDGLQVLDASLKNVGPNFHLGTYGEKFVEHINILTEVDERTDVGDADDVATLLEIAYGDVFRGFNRENTLFDIDAFRRKNSTDSRVRSFRRSSTKGVGGLLAIFRICKSFKDWIKSLCKKEHKGGVLAGRKNRASTQLEPG